MIKKILAAICFVTGIAAMGSSSMALNAEKLDAVTFVEELCIGDAQGLEEKYSFTQEMNDALASSGGLAGLQESLKTLGELKSTGNPIETENGDYMSYSVPCEFEVQNVNIVVSVDEDGSIAGLMTTAYQPEELTAELPEGVTEKDLNLPVADHEGWELPGTLTVPEGEGPFPAVVLVHGSGPNNRDEVIGPNKVFRDLAWGLAKQGIAVFRYDKRTYVYGEEMAADIGLTLEEETISDAVEAVKLLQGQENIRQDQVFVLGHSLGGQALPKISSGLKGWDNQAAGFIFLAAPARKLPVIMREQYDAIYGLVPQLSQEMEEEKAQVYQGLDLLDNLDKVEEDEAVMGAYKAYWQYLEEYDQVALAAEINEKCLVLQGEEDYQVTLEDSAMWERAYGEKENWSFRTYPGLTHLFTKGKKENLSADYNTPQFVDETVITDIAQFILEG